MKKLFAVLMMVLSLVGCVPQPSVSRTISLGDNSSELVQIPGASLADLSIGAHVDPAYDFYVSMEIVGCGYRNNLWAFNKNHAYGFYPWDTGPYYHVDGRDFSTQRRFIGVDFGSESEGWRVFVGRSEFNRTMRLAEQHGCNISDMIVVYTVYAGAERPVVVVNEHITE